METLNHVGVGWRGRRMDRPHPKDQVIGQTLGTDLSVCSSSTCLPVFLFLLRTFSYFFFSLSIVLTPNKYNSFCLLNWVRLKLQLSSSHLVSGHTLQDVLDRVGCKPSSVQCQQLSQLLIPGQLGESLASSCSGWRVLLLLSLFGLEAQLQSEALQVPQAHSSHYWSGWEPGLSLLLSLLTVLFWVGLFSTMCFF